jgi:hypothetical protein
MEIVLIITGLCFVGFISLLVAGIIAGRDTAKTKKTYYTLSSTFDDNIEENTESKKVGKTLKILSLRNKLKRIEKAKLKSN